MRHLRFLAILALAADARAAFEFADFATTTTRPFSFINQTTSGSITANAQVVFHFTAQSGLGTQDRDATLTMTATTFSPATPSGGQVIQPISSSGTLRLTENATGKNLLTLTFTGAIAGTPGTGNATLSGSDASGNTVAYTSDFLTFATPGNSYGVGLSSIMPGLSVGPGGFLNSFIANVNGQFTANAVAPSAVPEPASLAMVGLGLAGLGIVARRRRA